MSRSAVLCCNILFVFCTGFMLYTVVRPQKITSVLYKYAVRQVRDDDDHCEYNMLTLDGASGKCDPLHSIRNAELLIKDGAIVGVNVDGDCVVRKDVYP